MAGQTPSRTPEPQKPGAEPIALRIAAIMPIYNGRLWVEQAVRSILAQTVAPHEIIVIDDGSTDDSMDIVRAIAKEQTHIRILTQPNSGQSAARNLAISQCESEWIALIDQDDVWYPNHLEELAEVVSGHRGLRLGWAYSDFDDIDVDGRMVNRDFIDHTKVDNPKRDLIKVLAQGFIIQPSATLISREAILEVGGFDERLSGYEDDDLFLRIFRADYDNVFIPSPTSQWRIHASSAGGTQRTENSLRIYAQKVIDAFPDDKWRGHYYRRDVIAPRFIGIWLHMYIRAGRFNDRAKMRLYAREARVLVPYLRPRPRATMTAALFLLRQPLFIRVWAGSADGQSLIWTVLGSWARRMSGL
jgi:glycosyltransferase involved in cell wall biosynthesis